jgi:hypothetical protein
MSVLFIDKRKEDGEWQKGWHQICAGGEIINPDQLADREQAGGISRSLVLVVVHESAGGEHPTVKRLVEAHEGPCVMKVSANPLDGQTWADGRCHKSAIAFPANLGALTTRFERLVKELGEARGELNKADLRKRAWENWEEAWKEVLPALSVFCEGFLAAHVDELQEWKDAAKVMGLIAGPTDETQADIKPVLKQQKGWLANPASWLSVFGSINELRLNVESELASRGQKLSEQQKLSALLKTIEEGRMLSPAVVGQAYVNIRDLRPNS